MIKCSGNLLTKRKSRNRLKTLYVSEHLDMSECSEEEFETNIENNSSLNSDVGNDQGNSYQVRDGKKTR